ncbi:hypothetical protein AwMethylo_40900 [Methylobacterium sp.]|nr:hypothetical protein AwMethylo_40900 [Methylobacterium sp.]
MLQDEEVRGRPLDGGNEAVGAGLDAGELEVRGGVVLRHGGFLVLSPRGAGMGKPFTRTGEGQRGGVVRGFQGLPGLRVS